MADQIAATHAVAVSDVEYLHHPDGALLARLYRPEGSGPFPAIVEVHGGAWVNNDRLNNETAMRELAESGIVVLSLDFRMPPVAPYPASVQDINFAIRFLKSRAREWGSDPARVGGFGTSSGGHQILLAALRPHDPRYAALPGPAGMPAGIDASLAFVVSAWGCWTRRPATPWRARGPTPPCWTIITDSGAMRRRWCKAARRISWPGARRRRRRRR